MLHRIDSMYDTRLLVAPTQKHSLVPSLMLDSNHVMLYQHVQGLVIRLHDWHTLVFDIAFQNCLQLCTAMPDLNQPELDYIFSLIDKLPHGLRVRTIDSDYFSMLDPN